MRCFVFGCRNTRYLNKSVHLFGLPKDEITRQKWFEFSNCDEAQHKNIYFKICSDHFDKKCFYIPTEGLHKGKFMLALNSVPTIRKSIETTNSKENSELLTTSNDKKLFTNINTINDKTETSTSTCTEKNEMFESEYEELEAEIDKESVEYIESPFEFLPVNKSTSSNDRDFKYRKVTIRVALETSSDESDVKPNDSDPRQFRRKQKVKLLRNAFKTEQLKAKNARRQLKRATKQVEALKTTVDDLKTANSVQEEVLINKMGLSAPVTQFLKRQLCKAKGVSVPKSYEPELMTFANTLFGISRKAYDFVRLSFNNHMPHPKSFVRKKTDDVNDTENDQLPQLIQDMRDYEYGEQPLGQPEFLEQTECP